MPYKSDQELPSSVKDNLPRHARRIYRSAFNSAYSQYHDDPKAAAVAWSAVKSKYEKSKDDRWRLKKGMEATDLAKSAPSQWTMPVLLEKVKENNDGTLTAYGYGVEEAPDQANEIMDWGWSLPHFDKWSKAIYAVSGGKSLGNVRQMHGLKAVGKLTVYEPKPDLKKIWMAAQIFDPDTIALIKNGVLNGFSVGGSKGRKARDMTNPTLIRYEGIPAEMSVVDNPSMYGAKFAYIKADGAQELRKFVQGGQQVVEITAPVLGGDEIMDELMLRKVVTEELAKAAKPDPEKVILLIQAMRNQAELDGDADGANLFTQAISLVLQASGEEKSEPKAEQAAEGKGADKAAQEPAAPAEGDAVPAMGEDKTLAAAASVTTLKKVGRTFSGLNSQSMHNVIKTLAEMLAASGDETAAKIASMYVTSVEKAFGLDTLAKAADLTKAVGDMAKAADVQKLLGDVIKLLTELEHMDKRLTKVEALPVETGPALREVRTPGDDALASVLAKVTDPQARQAIEQQLSLGAIRAAQQLGVAVSPR